MQVENAAEWEKRERLSSEKRSLDRENKQLRLQIEDIQEQLRRQPTGHSRDDDIRALQDEITARNKVIYQ